MTLAEAAASGDRIALLRALRDRLATDLDECRSARDVAALSQRLMDVSALLDRRTAVDDQPAAEGREEVSPLDELKRRRAARGASTAG